MTGLNYSTDQAHGYKNLRIEGTVPDKLRGTLYRVGPGLVNRFGKEIHPFMADGLITSVSIDETPQGACQFVQTKEYLAEETAGKALYGPNANGLRRVYNGLTRKVKNTGNTNVLSWRDKLFALVEQGHPVEFEAENLETVGSSDLGVISGSFSAHPHRVDSLKTTFNFGVEGKRISIYALPDNGPANVLCQFDAPWAGIVHDFALTDNHAIFFIDPGKLVLWRAILGQKDFSKYFEWDESESTTAIILPLANPEEELRIEVDSFRVWHFANAYEDGDDIVIDAFRHENLDILISPVEITPDIPKPALYRYRISKSAKTMKGEQLTDALAEFPTINAQFVGHKHQYIWMQTYADKAGNDGFGRFDTETGNLRRYAAPDDHTVSEPMFVPNGPTETSGWVLQLIQDDLADKSYLGIFDAETFEDGPQAKLWFDHLVPATFHGTFVQDSSQRATASPS